MLPIIQRYKYATLRFRNANVMNKIILDKDNDKKICYTYCGVRADCIIIINSHIDLLVSQVYLQYFYIICYHFKIYCNFLLSIPNKDEVS